MRMRQVPRLFPADSITNKDHDAPSAYQPSRQEYVPRDRVPGILILGVLYVDAVYIFKDFFGLVSTTHEQISHAMEVVGETLERLDEERMDSILRRRAAARATNERIDQERKAKGLASIKAGNFSAINVGDAPELRASENDGLDEFRTPNQAEFGGVWSYSAACIGQRASAIYLNYRQLLKFIELTDTTYQLDEDWRERLEALFNEALPFYYLADDAMKLLVLSNTHSLLKTDFLRKFKAFSHEDLDDALAMLVKLGAVREEPTRLGSQGRPGKVYILNW